MSKKVYIVGPEHDTDEYVKTAHTLTEAGYVPVWRNLEVDDPNLRLAIAEITTCDAICLLDTWWTSREGMCLQTIAAWLRLEVLSASLDVLPTSSLRG
jgi:hypothetical protein